MWQGEIRPPDTCARFVTALDGGRRRASRSACLCLAEPLGFESVDAAEQERFHLNLGGDVDLATLARMRLSEHAIHTWDVAVALDPAATVSPDAVDLLVDTLDQLAARTGKPPGTPLRVHVSTTDPQREFVLDAGESVSLLPWDGEESLAELRLPAEAFLRLVYGRLDAEHTPRQTTAQSTSTSCEPPSPASDLQPGWGSPRALCREDILNRR